MRLRLSLNIVILLLTSKTNGNEIKDDVKICFPNRGPFVNYYPPLKNPENPKDIIYSVSNNQKISRPIIAYLCTSDGSHIPQSHSLYSTDEKPIYFEVASLQIEELDENKPKERIYLQEESVSFCQYSANDIDIWDPRRFDVNSKYYSHHCSPFLPSDKKLVLPPIRVSGSYLVVQGIYHVVKRVQRKFLRRQFEFSLKYKNKLIKAVTNPVTIYTHTAQLKWNLQPHPVKIIANHPFNISLEITDGINRIETGLDSSLIVEVTLSYKEKYFLTETMVEDFLYETSNYLTGEEVITSYRNYDRVIRKRANKGLIEIHNVVIQEIALNIKLNATLIVPRTFLRQPEVYPDKDCRVVKMSSENLKLYTVKEFCDDSTAVVYSQEFSVHPQHPDELVLIEPNGNSDYLIKDDFVLSSSEKIDDDSLNVTVTLNFEIPFLWVIVVDSDHRRIYSGDNSRLRIEVEAISDNKTVCFLSKPLILNRGAGKFRGSICELAKNVRLRFQSVNKMEATTKKMYNVIGDINIALFGRFNTAGHRDDLDPLVETFAKFAVNDLYTRGFSKNDFPLLHDKLWTLKLKVYDTSDDKTITAEKFFSMIEDAENDPRERIGGIIGFGSNYISRRMRALLKVYKFPIISYRETWREFVQNEAYMRMTCIMCNEVSYMIYLGYLLKNRGWTRIALIEDEIYSAFSLDSTLASFEIKILVYLKIINIENFAKTIKLIKELGTRVILFQVHAPLQYTILREAIKHNISCLDGYQWISIELPAEQFDWNNKQHECGMHPTCTEAFQGMILIDSGYNMTGYQNELWYKITKEFFEMNPAKYSGIPTYRDYTQNAHISLAYDAVVTFALAFEKLFNVSNIKKYSYTEITGRIITSFIKEYWFHGLTGLIKFAPTTGERSSCMVTLRTVIAKPFPTSYPQLKVTPLRWLMTKENYLESVLTHRKKRHIEANLTKYDERFILEVPMINIPGTTQPLLYSVQILPKHVNFVQRFYLSTKGYLQNHLTLTSHVNISDLDTICLRTEFVILSYYCSKGCGGNRLQSWNVIEYAHGKCIDQDVCQCLTAGEYYKNMSLAISDRIGFTGEFCQTPKCDVCKLGLCTSPYNCTCYTGWKGSDCSEPICTDGCVNGICVKPDNCECAFGYHGHRCQYLLGLIVVIILLSILFLVFCLVLLLRRIRKKKQEKVLLNNMDWLVNWEDVTTTFARNSLLPAPISPSTAFNPSPIESFRDGVQQIQSTQSYLNYRSILNEYSSGYYIEDVVVWKTKNCYAKKFARDSLDVNSMVFRMEIIQLMEMNHPNLVVFIGACLTAPNVALLLENVPKGSLTDILQSDKYNLTWLFKFSILRDIASGMEYIHNSKIGSHGRLKSTNCLIDNRWICKIAGFGVPSMRKVTSDSQDLEKVRRAMLWTSPELLRVSTSLSNVGKGTKQGDVYSFGIIITEICTHDLPFYYELEILTIEELLRILMNLNDHANRNIRKLLESNNYDTSNFIRPALVDSHLPESYTEKRGIQKLLLDTTAEEPNSRPSFKYIINLLNEIHPSKGEFIENHIYLLEKYTSHLEKILKAKTNECNLERHKTENLIDRLLPPTIADNFKFKQEIAPELYSDVTILFSEIIGFTSIAKELQPAEVVELLNDVYTIFNNIIQNFNVYNFQTIGVSYCIVSGAPNPCANHFEVISTLALHLLNAINSFSLKNMPLKRLQIRIGIHSGSCRVGLIGVKMPHYFIFGEDVVIAKYLESHGEPDFIHVSETTAGLLESVGGYNLIYRTELEIKFIGNLETYWLTGKEGFENKLVRDISEKPEVSGDTSDPSFGYGYQSQHIEWRHSM